MRLENKNKVQETFNKILEKKEKALICYIVGGYPDLVTCKEIIFNLIDSGADIIELGIPFSDPMADGPVIQNASLKALEMDVTPKKCFTLVKEIKRKYKDTPILVMTYSNIVFSNNLFLFLKTAKEHGVDGFIIPDLNFEEAYDYMTYSKKLGLSTVFLTSPNTMNNRVEKIADISNGFVYMVSVFGITGSKTNFESYTFNSIKRIKKITNKYNIPLAVGFGISNTKDAKKILQAGADGIIIGSSLINRITENMNEKDEMFRNLRTFIKELKNSCR